MNEIVVVIPVYQRPGNAPRVYGSLKASKPDARALFVCSPKDTNEIRACQGTGADVLIVDFPRGPGDWARKINTALHQTSEPYLFLGADDLRFHPGWDRQALLVAKRSGAGVVGINDLGNMHVRRGLLATHALVTRSYAMEQGTIDEPGKILHEGYYHNWVDWELTETAMSRRQFSFARRSYVEHLHPLWKKGQMDSTYELALDRRRYESDHELLQERRVLWRDALRAVRPRHRSGRGRE